MLKMWGQVSSLPGSLIPGSSISGSSIPGFPLLAVLILGVLVAGCAGKGVKPSPLPDFESRHEVRIAWRASAGISKRYIFSPVYAGNAVCAAGYAGRLSCFDSRNGRRLWTSTAAGVAFSGGVGVGENMILVGSTKGEALAFGTDGTLLWRSQLSSEILGAPVGSGSTVIVRTGDSKIFGLDARDGRQIWQYQAPEQPLTLRSNPGLAIVDDTAVISGSPGGRLAKLGITDGGLLWETAVATPRGDNELERVADIAGTPLVEDGRVYTVTYQGRIGCFDTQKGTQIWARDASSAGSLSADSSSVYYTEADSVVVALDRATGASVWRQEKLLHRRVSSPLVIGDWVVVGDYEGYVHVLSREDGSFVARIGTDGSDIIAAPVLMNEHVVLLTQSGGLYVIALDG